jgi:uncharacterized membrane protein YqjE
MTMQSDRQAASRVEQFDTTEPRVAITTGQAEPSLGQLLNELTGDMSTLVRQELELAKAETMQKVSQATRSIIMMVAGGLLAYAGLIAIVIAAAIALGSLMPYWLSSLIVGLVVVAIGGILVMSGRSSLANLSLVPENTVETLKQDAQWAKEQIS